MQIVEPDRLHPDVRAGRTVAVMFGQVEDEAGPRDAHVEGQVRREAVFEGNLETEPAEVEFARLLLREDAQNRDCAAEARRHEAAQKPVSGPFSSARDAYLSDGGCRRGDTDPDRPGGPERHGSCSGDGVTRRTGRHVGGG